MLERCNSSALAIELHLSCINPLIWLVLISTSSGALFYQQRLNEIQSMDLYIYFSMTVIAHPCFNSLRARQNGCHSPDDILKFIFLNENVRVSIKISGKFVLKGPINNIPALVQTMAWRRPCIKPLSESMMVSLPTHICITQCQWVNFNCWFGYMVLKYSAQVHE